METTRTPRAEHVVLISVDGLRPEYYLDERSPAPAMRQLYLQGAHARAVRSIFPSLTYPGHTTLATGALPARHGVSHDREVAPVEDPEWLQDAARIQVPALWDAVRAAGGTTAAVGWPVTVGAAIDWNLPDVWPQGGEEAFIGAVRNATVPGGLFEELEREATGRLRSDNFSNRLLAHDLRVASMAAYLLERYRPTLLLAHTQATVQVPQEPDWRNPRRARAVAASDQVVSMVLEVVERTESWGRTAVLVTGDHGMMEVHTQVRPNVWLREAGLRPERLGGNEWRATFHALGGSAFLRLAGPEEENLTAARRVLEKLPPAQRNLFRIVEKEEIDALGSDPEAPLALAASPGIVLDSAADGAACRPNPGMTHGHHPECEEMNTGFVACGAGVRSGAAAPLLRLADIAPTVAALLGLHFDAPDGTAFPGLLTE